MHSVTKVKEARIVDVEVTDDMLTLHLEDGRSISAPIDWYPRLARGSAEERRNFRLIGRGEGVHWPELDEDVGVEGVLSGLPSREGPASLKRWLKKRKSQ